MLESIDEKMIAQLNSMSSVYRLLSRLVISEVDVEFLTQLGQSPLSESFLELGGILPDSPASQAVNELAGDFCQLFIGPTNHLPPYQSVWEYGQFQSQTTSSMQAFVDIARYTPSKIANNMMLDHLGIQLDLMGHILVQITSVKSAEERGSIIDFAATFANDHLRWPEPLLWKASEKAQTPFYQSSLKVIGQFLSSEMQFWNSSQK